MIGKACPLLPHPVCSTGPGRVCRGTGRGAGLCVAAHYLGVQVLHPGLDSTVLTCCGYQGLPGNNRSSAVRKCSPILHVVFIPGESAQQHQ